MKLPNLKGTRKGLVFWIKLRMRIPRKETRQPQYKLTLEKKVHENGYNFPCVALQLRQI